MLKMKVFKSIANFALAINIFMLLLFLIYQHLTYYQPIEIEVNIFEGLTGIEDFNYTFEFDFASMIYVIIFIAVFIIVASINVAASGLTDSGSKKLAFIIVYIFFFFFISVVSSFFFDMMPKIGSFITMFSIIIISIDGVLKLGGLYSDE